MDLNFKKKTKINFIKSSQYFGRGVNSGSLKQFFISHNLIKLTYIIQFFSGNQSLTNLQLQNGSLLILFSEYSKVLRKSMLPWLCAVKLSKKVTNKESYLVLNPFSLRHRNVLRAVQQVNLIILIFSWTSPFYRTKRIKRWLSKKYTNRLWR